MLINSKIALSLALLVATTSGAMAASKHAVGHHSAMAHSATTYLSFGVLLCLRCPLPGTYALAGREHGRTIPLADIRP